MKEMDWKASLKEMCLIGEKFKVDVGEKKSPLFKEGNEQPVIFGHKHNSKPKPKLKDVGFTKGQLNHLQSEPNVKEIKIMGDPNDSFDGNIVFDLNKRCGKVSYRIEFLDGILYSSSSGNKSRDGWERRASTVTSQGFLRGIREGQVVYFTRNAFEKLMKKWGSWSNWDLVPVWDK